MKKELGGFVDLGLIDREGIQVKSKLGVGTSFKVLLPLRAPQTEGSGNGAMQAASGG